MFFRPTCHFFFNKNFTCHKQIFQKQLEHRRKKAKNEKNEITNTVFCFFWTRIESYWLPSLSNIKKFCQPFLFLFFNSTGIRQNWKGCCNNFENHFFSCITSVQKSHVSCFTSVHTFSKKQQKHFFSLVSVATTSKIIFFLLHVWSYGFKKNKHIWVRMFSFWNKPLVQAKKILSNYFSLFFFCFSIILGYLKTKKVLLWILSFFFLVCKLLRAVTMITTRVAWLCISFAMTIKTKEFFFVRVCSNNLGSCEHFFF